MLYCIIGKSASGKDTIFTGLMGKEELGLRRLITCTTRPKRPGEKEGIEYSFVSEASFREMDAAGRIIEKRAYDTRLGMWYYFTTDETDVLSGRYLVIATVDSCASYISRWGKENVLPIYLEASDHTILLRYINREAQREEPRYDEVCRRFLADREDFSEERLSSIGVTARFSTEEGPDECIEKVAEYIRATF